MADHAGKPRIAVFSGPSATVQNSEPLVTSNQARAKYGLPLLTDAQGVPLRYDVVRAQRLAAPVTVYVEQFSAHPLERDAAELYGPPDGYLDHEGRFHPERQHADDVPVYEVTLRPEDGLYFLPYMARQANGQAWDHDGAEALAPAEQCRQPFFPDASRMFEEIDRFGLGEEGVNCPLWSAAEFDFYRAAPSGGYKKGLPERDRTDFGTGDIPPERLGEDFFPYRPRHLSGDPTGVTLARLTNCVQRAMASGRYLGGIWLEGSPYVEETTWWLNLLIDTTVPIAGNSSQRAHGAVGNDGDRNMIDSVHYILSRIWADAEGCDRVGAVAILDELIYTSREVQKADARPGGYTTTGGHGGIVGTIGEPGPPQLTFIPVKRHTFTSEVNLSRLPATVQGTRRENGRIITVPVRIKDAEGNLLPTAIPKVTISKFARYLPDTTASEASTEVEILARIEKNLRDAPLAGLVAEAGVPFASMSQPMETALKRAAFCGMPTVLVGRGNAEGVVPGSSRAFGIAGSNLTATKARLLLMACLMRLGSLPPAADPDNPTAADVEAMRAKLEEYQAVFDTH
jgi:hypothetical protein